MLRCIAAYRYERFLLALLLLSAGCEWRFASTVSQIAPTARAGFAASVGLPGEQVAALRYIPRRERWDDKVIGTIQLEPKRFSTVTEMQPVEIRRIHRGYALERAVHENDAGQRWMLTTSYSREHEAMAGICLRWSF